MELLTIRHQDFTMYVECTKFGKAQFGSMLQSDNECFSFRRGVLAGFINYGNDISKSEQNLIYQMGSETRQFTFGYEVLSFL